MNDGRCLEKGDACDPRIFPVAVGRPPVGCVSAASWSRRRLRRRPRRGSEGRFGTRGSLCRSRYCIMTPVGQA